MIIRHELIKKQKKSGKSHFQADVDIFPLAEELYLELEKLGFVEQMKRTPQLGTVRVDKKLEKSRYDYMMLQIHFHWLVKKNLPNLLYRTYNNKVNPDEFRSDLVWSKPNTVVTIADLIQILTIANNIGHFRNTFVASRALLIHAQKNPDFRGWIISQSSERRYQMCAAKILDSGGYKRFQLLNALLVLERCDQQKLSVQIAQELIYAYINEDQYPEDSKLCYAFWLFRAVRNVAFIAYDLQVSKLPFVMDLSNSKAILLLLEEHLSAYSCSHSTEELIRSLGKMLDDNMYNQESHVICHYEISKKIVRCLEKNCSWKNMDLYTYLRDSNSPFNRAYPQKIDYVGEGMLRLTFAQQGKTSKRKVETKTIQGTKLKREYNEEERIRAERECRMNLFAELERMHGVRVGYYDRNNAAQTIIVSLSKDNAHKEQTAFRVMQTVVKHLRRIPGLDRTDPRYLLAAKFFLFYLVNRNPLLIKPTIQEALCVTCAKGFKQNQYIIQSMINGSQAKEDTIHEADFLCKVMLQQGKKDLCIAICGSIQVFEKATPAKGLCEFDGMLLYPNRKQGQIIFLEAKNKDEKPSTGKKELKKKLRKLQIPHVVDEIIIDGHDAFYVYSVQDLVRQ